MFSRLSKYLSIDIKGIVWTLSKPCISILISCLVLGNRLLIMIGTDPKSYNTRSINID